MKTLLLILALVSTSLASTLDNTSEKQLTVNNEEVKCLALNIYHEARGENLAGKYAVADVTLNRAHSTYYPNTVCGVVKQAVISKWWKDKKNKIVPVRNKCQFSWYCDGRSDTPTNESKWYEAQYIAVNMLSSQKFRGLTEGATHYHATYVDPSWNKSLTLVGRIGQHIFYRVP